MILSIYFKSKFSHYVLFTETLHNGKQLNLNWSTKKIQDSYILKYTLSRKSVLFIRNKTKNWKCFQRFAMTTNCFYRWNLQPILIEK